MSFFSDRGFNGTTTKEIAVAAGISEAVIYQHFPTKEDFYTSVLDEHTKRIFSRRWLDSLKEYADTNQEAIENYTRLTLSGLRCFQTTNNKNRFFNK